MRTAKVVIGANYGDEGKGLMTDYFAAQGGHSLVVRFNGGCQASHTVTTPDGKRHAFSHFGAGTFAGAQTYLSRHFAVNPALYLKERIKLLPIAGRLPLLLVDERAPVTTFFDMLVNQMVEDFRGANRHGSCGMGFGETIGRHEGKAFALVAKDLLDVQTLREKLVRIRDVHLPARCKELGLPDFGQHHELCTSDALVHGFIEASQEFLADVMLVPSAAPVLAVANNVVFEGAQGLLLDQHRGAFPYVTRSNTGLRNALDVAREAGLEALGVTYATRAYLTRHGAGPLAHELPGRPYDGVVDLTNQPNDYQGSLRFAYLDHDLLAQAIRIDLADAAGAGMRVTARLAVSCLDQVDEHVRFWEDGQLKSGAVDDQLCALGERVLPVGFCSFGPTRDTMGALGECVAADWHL
ncbi:hypothetical protein WJ97_12995 [Burkholderia ubonensis]|uniref:adenylosuccinate synthetase n=1 Tax=Burkholderia ubonensis TaxID=101571 RepID=UPI00075A8FBD|nr:adenylosuccinate synthetase [Burkholderia ubonensis]KVP96791.1 hypothetical protein WJ97_12995 [Burkholderia ubonensis]